MGEKFGEFGESSVIRQTKTIQILLIIITLWLNLSIRQTLITSEFAKLSRYTVFVFSCHYRIFEIKNHFRLSPTFYLDYCTALLYRRIYVYYYYSV